MTNRKELAPDPQSDPLIGDSLDPAVEGFYWEGRFRARPYYEFGLTFADYEPAYRYGWETRSLLPVSNWEAAEGDLATGWGRAKGGSRLSWEQARGATHDAWDRIERRLSAPPAGDPDV
jgi:hypothetical protein